MKHFNINVYGIVQGVGFRYAAKQHALYLGIKGFVRNEPDGSVYIEVEGDNFALAEFVQWCRKGPAYASVEEVKVEEGSLKNFISFDTKF